MLRHYIFSTFLLFTADVVLCKPDYVFHSEVNGWLKVHPIPATWKDAFLRCYYEGAVLASPLTKELGSALRANVANTLLNHPIFIGTHALYSEGTFFSVEGVPLEDMPIKTEQGISPGVNTGACLTMDQLENSYMYRSDCTQAHPYICFKKRENDTHLNNCGTFDNDYGFDKRTGSCYKLHKDAKEWSRAHMICAAEGGYLVILNNEEEAGIVNDMFENLKPRGNRMHIGLRDLHNDGTWFTIHGEPLKDVFNTWAHGQPDNYRDDQYCGNLVHNKLLDDYFCHRKAPFVCEKDPNTISYGPVHFNDESSDLTNTETDSVFK